MKYEKLKDDSKEKFGLYIRKLLKTSFISEENDEVGFSYIKSNNEAINEYLNVIGYELNINYEIRVAGIREVEQDEKQAFSLKLSLKKYQMMILLCIWQLYGEKLKNMDDECVFEISELNTMLDTFYASKRLTVKEREDTLKLFERHGLIDVVGKDYTNAKTRVRMFSALNLCFETAEYEKIKDEWINELKDDGGEKDDREAA